MQKAPEGAGQELTVHSQNDDQNDDNDDDDDDEEAGPVKVDGRKKRSEATNARKQEFGNKHSQLDKTKVSPHEALDVHVLKLNNDCAVL